MPAHKTKHSTAAKRAGPIDVHVGTRIRLRRHLLGLSQGLKDDSLDDPDLLPPPDEVAAEIVENLETALTVAAKLQTRVE